MIRELDVHSLREKFASARPFPHIVIDDFLDPDFAREVAASYPSFEEVERIGVGYETVNEHRKIQVTEYDRFPAPTKALSDALRGEAFLRQLSEITGIPDLAWDEQMVGGGMHQTASSGILDVHVDFNLLEERQLFRRLNILVYLNETWDASWGGLLELWDENVKVRHREVHPALGRAVLFETSEISFHGVTAVQCPPDIARKSFAAYYYTKQPPPAYSGKPHTTIFKARPHEHQKRFIQMPIQRVESEARRSLSRLKSGVKTILRR